MVWYEPEENLGTDNAAMLAAYESAAAADAEAEAAKAAAEAELDALEEEEALTAI